MKILNVADREFYTYGRVIEGLDVSELLEVLKETPKPDDVIYVASDEKLEACACADKIAYSLYGGMPIQIGYCNGSNVFLNAVEYHRDSEVNVALTDLILILGREQDVDGNKFCTAVILPKGTNTEAPQRQNNTEEDKLLFARNKWLIAHKDAKIEGAFEGLKGENLSVE